MSSPITSTATSLPPQLLEVAQSLSNAEKALPVETRPDNITLACSFKTKAALLI